MVSLYFEPTTLASFFAFSLILVVFGGMKLRLRRLWVAVLVAAGVLCMSKAFFVALALIAWFLVFPTLRPIYLTLAVLGVFGVSALIVSLGLPGGYFAHLQGFYHGVLFALDHPLGAGLGVGGNYADLSVSAGINPEAGAESGLGNLIVQLGMFALLYLIAIHLALQRLRAAYDRTGNGLFRAAFVALLFWSLTLIMSASSLGASGNVFYFVLTGLLLSPAHAAEGGVLKVKLRTNAMGTQGACGSRAGVLH